jgi:polysaccharide biosynthesis/export protein
MSDLRPERKKHMSWRVKRAIKGHRSVEFWLHRTFALCAILFLSACQSSHESFQNEITTSTPVRLSAGDVIKVSFSGAPELSQSQKINADGKVNLPIVGEVKASGKAISELQKELMGLYKPQLRNNELVVTLESGVVNVVVSGFVTKPGKLTFDRPTTVFQAIMEAGGISEYGNASKVRLVRTINGEQHTDAIDLKSAIKGRSTRVTYVRDGDVIYVPQRLF